MILDIVWSLVWHIHYVKESHTIKYQPTFFKNYFHKQCKHVHDKWAFCGIQFLTWRQEAIDKVKDSVELCGTQQQMESSNFQLNLHLEHTKL